MPRRSACSTTSSGSGGRSHPGWLKELNALLLNGVERMPAHPGEYKTPPNHVLQLDGTIHHSVEPLQVADAVEALCEAIACRCGGTGHAASGRGRRLGAS